MGRTVIREAVFDVSFTLTWPCKIISEAEKCAKHLVIRAASIKQSNTEICFDVEGWGLILRRQWLTTVSGEKV